VQLEELGQLRILTASVIILASYLKKSISPNCNTPEHQAITWDYPAFTIRHAKNMKGKSSVSIRYISIIASNVFIQNSKVAIIPELYDYVACPA
jgi:lipid A disaccharide synthetase